MTAPEPTRPDPGLPESRRAFPLPRPRRPPERRGDEYKVEITKPGLTYCIEIGHGCVKVGPWHTLTLAGARRKARRLVERDRRVSKLIEGWTE